MMEGGRAVCSVELPRLVRPGTGVAQEQFQLCERRCLNSEPASSPGPMCPNGGGIVRLEVGLQPQSDSKLHKVKITIPQGNTTGPTSADRCTNSVPTSNKQAQALAAASPTSTTACRRNLLQEFEKDLTFRPKLNNYSLRIVARNPRTSIPVVHRLLEARGAVSKDGRGYQKSCSFAPKMNALSVKLAQERVSRKPEVQARMAQLAAARTAEAYSQYTFRPNVSQRSLKIAEGLGTSFLARQQLHLERRQKVINTLNKACKSPPRHLNRCQRLVRLFPRPPPTSHDSPEVSTESSSTGTRPSVSAAGNRTDSEYRRSTTTEANTSKGERRKTSLKSHSHTRTPSLPLQSPSRQSLSDKEGERSPPGHIRRTSSVPNTPSPEKTRHRERTKARRCTTSPQPASLVKTRATNLSIKFVNLNEPDRVKRVKVMSERIMKDKKVFLLRGGYRTIRRCLRKRGWVEQDYNKVAPPPTKPRAVKKRKRHTSQDVESNSDSSDDSDVADLGDQGSEEECSDEEEYCMLSRAVRSSTPNFVWTLKRDGVLYRTLHRDTFVNHFAKASSFTTKCGLCTNLRNLLWYGDTDPNTFYPRCYRLSCEEEKEAFIEDYRFTAALSLLKAARDQLNSQSHPPKTPSIQHHSSVSSPPQPFPGRPSESPTGHDRGQRAVQEGEITASEGSNPHLNKQLHQGENGGVSASCTSPPHQPPSRPGSIQGSRCSSRLTSSPSPLPAVVPEEAIKLALRACEVFLGSKEHEDIEGSQCQLCPKLSDAEWTSLVQHSYSARLESTQIFCSYHLVRQADSVLVQIRKHFPQLQMDGSRNIWIVKPGAQSRGRGIMCMDRLDEVLDLVSSQITGGLKESKWVVQKYIERPMLIHRTKFDIRQWFLVTDWNPLTMWMYKDCYLRFSTQTYTLDNLSQSIHLCNNSIQKNCENSSSRSDLLPEENMWDSDMFQDHLRSLGEGDKWDSVIYPGMRQALIHVLQVTQDEIEQRKNAFELYGADFMISEDFKPWLIEINCSPTMEASTDITTRMCRQVMEDLIRVVVDRRENKDCGTGRFELVYKQPKLEVPTYVGIQLRVVGSAIPQRKLNSPQKVPAPTVKLGYTTGNF